MSVSPENLLAIVEGSIKSFGYKFGDDLRPEINEMIASCVNGLGDNPDFVEVKVAQRNLLLIASSLVEETKVTFPESLYIPAKIFRRVKSYLCPLPPIWYEPCN